jgi:hypothetical protein
LGVIKILWGEAIIYPIPMSPTPFTHNPKCQVEHKLTNKSTLHSNSILKVGVSFKREGEGEEAILKSSFKEFL